MRIGHDYNVSSPPVRYFTQEKYREIADPYLHELGDKAKKALYFAFGALFAFMISTLSSTVGAEMGWF